MSWLVLDRALALRRQWFQVEVVVGPESAGSWFEDGKPASEMARPNTLLATGYGQQCVDKLTDSLLHRGMV